MFKNIWGWYPENIKQRSASVEKIDVLIEKKKKKRVYTYHWNTSETAEHREWFCVLY